MWEIVGVVFLGVFGYLFNEWRKRRWERFKSKEARYIALVESLKGFYTNTEQNEAQNMKEEFLKQLSLCWLYCPDTVIQKAYGFLDQVQTGVRKSDEEKQRALGAFVLELRKDLLKTTSWWEREKTKLTESDFRPLRST